MDGEMHGLYHLLVGGENCVEKMTFAPCHTPAQ